jgi:hypothetical protein
MHIRGFEGQSRAFVSITMETSSEKPKKIKKPGRWRRRAIWSLVILIAIGVVLRAILPLALPMVLRKVAGTFNLNCSYDRLELNLSSGDAGIWGLEFTPKEGGTAILSADYCHGNISVLNLFRGKLNVWRVEADGVDVTIDRNEKGEIPLLNRFVASTAPPATAPAAITPTSAKPSQLDLTSPLRVDALRLDHIRVHIRDKGVSPEVDTELAMDLRLSDLGSPTHKARFEMNLSADPLLDTLRINGEGQSSGKTLDANMNVLVRGIRLKPAAAYLAPLGIRPVSDGITLTAQAQVHTRPAPNNAEGFTASLALDHLSANADRAEALALDHLAIDTGVIDTKSIRIEQCIADGARANAGRAADGNLQVAGIEYDPTLVAKTPPPATQPSTPSPLLTELMKEKWSVGQLALKNARAVFDDQGIKPEVHVSLIADELSANSIDHDPANLNTSVTLTGRLRAPGLIGQINLDGSATPFASDKLFNLKLAATGIKPDAVKPYLDQVGIESTLKNAQFSANLKSTLTWTDTITAGLHVTGFDFRDETPLLALSDITIDKAALNPATGAISVADIELVGPGISVLRDSNQNLRALGLQTKPATPVEKPIRAVATTAPAAQSFSVAALPRITIAKFGWTGIHVDLQDDATEPATKISIPDIGISASDLSTDLRSQSKGKFKLWLASPQLARHLQLDGELEPLSDGIATTARLSGEGLDATQLAPYLQPLGIKPLSNDGSLTGNVKAAVRIDQKQIAPYLQIDGLNYHDGPAKFASVQSLEISNAAFSQDGLAFTMSVDGPHISAGRAKNGDLLAAGFELLPAPPADPNAIPAAVAKLPTTQATPQARATTPLIVSIPKITVKDAGIDWTDLAVEPNVKTSASASVHIDNLTLGKQAAPALVNITARVDGSVDSVLVGGTISAAPSQQSALLDVSVDGIRPGALAAYLPAGIGSTLKNGVFVTHIQAGIAEQDASMAAELSVGATDFQDQDISLFHLDSAHLKAPRIALPDTALAVDEISVQGLRTHAEKLPTGGIAAMGLLVEQKPVEPKSVSATTKPVTVVSAKTPTTGPSIQDLLAASHRVLPAVTVNTLDLNVANFTFSDKSRPDSKALEISDLRLHNVNRIDWLGKDADNKPPTQLQFVCKVSPLVDQVLVDIAATPFVTRQPHLNVRFAATGVHGDGLTQLIPELKDQLDGSAMSNGSLTAHLTVDANLDRKNPLDFDLSHGFDLSVVLDKVAYRSQPDGPVLAGVDEVRSENIRVAPADSLVHFKTVEITQPIGLLTADAAGIHALGWTYKLPKPTTQPVANQPAATQPIVVVARPEEKPAGPVVKPTSEIRIDKLLISGLDFNLQDTAVSPPLMIPLNGLDVEVRNISSLAPYEDRPIRFSAIVNAGKVSLPKRGSNPPVMEDRDLFSQVTASGEISLYPKLHGWTKTSVSSLDLAALQGAAAQFNETLTAGLYDSEVDLKFDPTGAVAINSHFTLTDLSLTEPEGGLLAQTLHMPLNVAIGVMQGADGSIPLSVPAITLDPNHISYLEIGRAAAGTIAGVVTNAAANAPAKGVNSVTSLIGLGGDKTTVDLTAHVPFAPGSAAYANAQAAALAPLLKQLHDDPLLTVTVSAQLSNADVDVLRVRANPTREQSESIESHLRARKAELLTLRGEAGGKARADLVSLGATAAAPSLDRLRAIDREIAATDESLDQVGELLKPGAERLADRRTKAAAIAVSNDRLASIRAALLAAGVSKDRINPLNSQYHPADDLKTGEVVLVGVPRK